MKLAETQRAFWELATRGPAAQEHDPALLFESTPELAAAERISIYADMFLWRQVDALREDFPKLAAALGEDPFYALAEAYLRTHPSVHHDLGKLGKMLAAFVSGRSELSRPDFADLAALEWARSEVFGELQLPAASADFLSSLPEEQIPQTRLQITPALRIVTLRHDPVPLWAALEDGAGAPAAQPGRTHVAVWRKQYAVYHAALNPDEAEAVRKAQLGATLAEICDAFAGREDGARAAFEAIGSWFVEEWVVQPEKGTE